MSDFLQARFPFLFDGVYLNVQVNRQTERQLLIFERMNPKTNEVEFTDMMECIHTVLATIPYDEYDKIKQNPDEQAGFIRHLNGVSSEYHPLDISVEEKFFAFKSWAIGIAEAGIDALLLQSEVDEILEGSIPIFNFLFKNLIRANVEMIPQFLTKIEQQCRFEGACHKASLRANLTNVLNAITELDCLTNVSDILRMIADLDSEFLFHFSSPEILKRIAGDSVMAEYDEFRMLFQSSDTDILKALAFNPQAVTHPEFRLLFHNKNDKIREFIAENPNAPRYLDFKLLFSDSSFYVRRKALINKNSSQFSGRDLLFPVEWGMYDITEILSHPNSTSCPEFKLLFSDSNPHIRKTIARLPEAAKFTEFSTLFKDRDHEVRKAIAGNPEAVIYPEFVDLIKFDSSEVQNIAINNRNVGKIPEFLALFTSSDDKLRYKLAKSSTAPLLPQYATLFSDKKTSIRQAVAKNPKAIRFLEYKKLFTDEKWQVRASIVENPKAVTHPEFSLLYKDLNSDVRRTAITTYGNNLAENFGIFIADKDPIIRTTVASIQEAVKCPTFPKLFTDSEKSVRQAVAENLLAPTLIEYRKLFSDPDFYVRRCVANNPQSATLPEFNTLFPKEWTDDIIRILGYPEAVKYLEFRLLFSDTDRYIKQNLARCHQAAQFPEFAQLLSDSDTYRDAAENPKAICNYLSTIEKMGDDPYLQNRMSIIHLYARVQDLIEKKLPVDRSCLSELVCNRNMIYYWEESNRNREEMQKRLEYIILSDLIDYDKAIIAQFLTCVRQISEKIEPKPREFIQMNLKMLGGMLEDKYYQMKLSDYQFEQSICVMADLDSQYVIPGNWQISTNTDEFIAGRDSFTKHEGYRAFFDMLDFGLIGSHVARNRGAVRFSEYKAFFTDKYRYFWFSVAHNESACSLPEFMFLLDDKCEEIREAAQKTLSKAAKIKHQSE